MTRKPTEVERQRLHRTFEALCRIESPTGNERACADWITGELNALGLEVEEDDAGRAVGSNAGNLLARIPGTGPRSILLCAHMDTVPLAAPVNPVLRDGFWENEHDAILGADNKAAVAAILEAARHLITASQPPEAGVELLFTISEETGLKGASRFDLTRLQSEFGFVFDHATPIGEIIAAAPTHMHIAAEVRGRAAHAGLEPERGVNAIIAAANAVIAMPQGRLDAETTANVGVIEGGTATNVVPESCRLRAEVRAIEQARLDEVVTQAIDALQGAADSAACDLDVNVERSFTGYRLPRSDESVHVARVALESLGYEPRLISSGGGSDANAFRLAGFPCTNLPNGTERAHQPDERVSAAALEGNLELMLALLDAVAAREA